MAAARFDLGHLFLSVDAARQRRELSWAAVAREVGVAASTIRRFGEADDAEADGVLSLVRWLEAAPEDFIDGGSARRDLLPAAGGGVVRVDLELVARACGDSRGARGGTRTSIQRLVAVADDDRRSVASLTRLSEV